MVGPLMLQKILHCRNSNINKQGKRQRNKRSSTNRNIKRLEETCRICLNKGTVPIIKSASNKDLMSSINTFGAINMHPDDAHPKHICQSCYNLLKSAIKFRKTAQKSDKLLCEKSINLPEINISVEHSYSYSSDAHNVDDGNVSDPKEILTHNDSLIVLQDETNDLCPKEETYSEHSFINDENTDSNQSINQENHSKTKTEKSIHLKNLQGEEEACNDQNETINSKEKKKRPRLRCKRCDLHFNNLNDYTEHRLSLEHENKRVTCNVCKKTYAPQYLKKHMLLHTPNSTQIIDVCDICGKSFKHRGLLSRHRLTHTYELPFQCSICPYKGRYMTALRMHMRSHTGERPYPCPTCPSKFVSKSNLNKHMLTHKETFDFHCEACGRGFHTKRTLEMHIRADHNGVKEHKCRFCGKEFGYRKLVIKHELKVHKREKMRSGRMPIYLKVEAMKQKNQIENTGLMEVELDNGNIKSAI